MNEDDNAEATGIVESLITRSGGGPLALSEIKSLIAMLDDTRQVPDPNDPPSYDWMGGAPQAGGSTTSPSAKAAVLLREIGGEALYKYLEQAISTMENPSQSHHESPAESIARVGAIVAKFVDRKHPWLLRWLQSSRPELRSAALYAARSMPPLHPELITAIITLLADRDPNILREVFDVCTQLEFWLTKADSTLITDEFIEQVRRQVESASTSQEKGDRYKALAILTALTQRWGELAALIKHLSIQDVQWLLNLNCISSKELPTLISIDHETRAKLKSAIISLFRSQKPATRILETTRLLCFAPDEDAIELALEEVRVRSEAAYEFVELCRSNPAMHARVIEATFSSMKIREPLFPTRWVLAGTNALFELLKADIDKFAEVIKADPSTMIQRLDVLEILSFRSTSSEYKDLLSKLRHAIAKVAPSRRKLFGWRKDLPS